MLSATIWVLLLLPLRLPDAELLPRLRSSDPRTVMACPLDMPLPGPVQSLQETFLKLQLGAHTTA
eukprot:6192855-Pleurochrysis_carterae.AAC.3